MRPILELVFVITLLLAGSRLLGITTNVTDLDRWVAALLGSVGLG